jgi:2-polyprenyl-6-methoxyphenol hydroxylase-like FAD-dependent oxidoreductase
MDQTEVIVAGAGPVGLVAALVLAQAGVKVNVLERREQLNQASKASTFHPPTLTILDRLGVFGVFNERAQHVGAQQYRTTERGVIGNLRYDTLQGLTPHPFRKHLEQALLTPLLLEKLRSLPNARVDFNSALTGIEANDDGGVTVTVSREAGLGQQLEARYLIGADGAHSRVREAAGIAFEAAPYPGRVVRARAEPASLDRILPGMEAITYLVSDTHSASFLRMPDCWRIILRVPAGTDDETAMSDAWIFERLHALVPSMRVLPELVGRDVYGASKAAAARNRVGSVYLCGDAVHLTNTRGGMNMNCGIHDSYTVARAMVRALRDGDETGLHAAAAERLRVATGMLLPRTDDMVSQEGDWIDRVSKLLNDPEHARNYLYKSAMLDMVDLNP